MLVCSRPAPPVGPHSALPHHSGLQNLLQNILFGNLNTPHEMSTTGQSGAFFFMCNDGDLMIKSLKEYEADMLIRVLPDIVNHFKAHPDSLLAKFCGLYKTSHENIYFTVPLAFAPRPCPGFPSFSNEYT